MLKATLPAGLCHYGEPTTVLACSYLVPFADHTSHQADPHIALPLVHRLGVSTVDEGFYLPVIMRLSLPHPIITWMPVSLNCTVSEDIAVVGLLQHFR